RPLSRLYTTCCFEKNKMRVEDEEFFLWLERQVLKKIPSVPYLSETQLENYTITLKEGLFYSKEGLFTSDEKTLCVIDYKNRILVSPFTEELKHSSLSLGEPVFFAGHVSIREGYLDYIDNLSGHYLTPASQIDVCLRWLRSKGMNLNPNLKIKSA